MPPDAMLTLPGLALTLVMNSGTVLAGTEGVHLYGKRLTSNARDRRNVTDKIELEIFVECSVTRVRKTSQQKRIAIRGRMHDGLGGDISAGTRPVLDNELLAEPLREPLPYQACHDVGATSGGKSDNDAHRPRRRGLRPPKPRDGREPGRARCHTQKSSTE